MNPDLSAQYRTSKWSEWDSYDSNAVQSPREEITTGIDFLRKDWVSLNRVRAKVGKTASSLHKWNSAPTSECTCGEPKQTYLLFTITANYFRNKLFPQQV